MTRRSRPRARPSGPTPEQKALLAHQALLDHRAVDLVMLDMRPVTTIADYFLICHGTSTVHIQSLAEAVREAFEEHGVRPYGAEGEKEARWVLLDYGDVIVHIFSEEDRVYYDLERLWSDAPEVTPESLAEVAHEPARDPR